MASIISILLLLTIFVKVGYDVGHMPEPFGGQRTTSTNPVDRAVGGLRNKGEQLGGWLERTFGGGTASAQTPEPTQGSSALPRVRIGEAGHYKYDRKAQYGGSWVDTDGNGCDTRNDVLRAHGTNVVLAKGGCKVLSSEIRSVYTGTELRQTVGGGQVEIDHLVPLSYAHQHGAALWTQGQRIAFANDQQNLLPVDSKSNTAKGDSGPGEWVPSDTSYRCTYGTNFLTIIAKYDLTVSQSDYDAVVRACR